MLSTLYFVTNTIWMMSIKGTVLVLGVVLLRFIFKNIPSRIYEIMWIVVAYCFLCPISLSVPIVSECSSISNEFKVVGINKGTMNTTLGGSVMLAIVWMVGILVLIGSSCYRYYRVCKMVNIFKGQQKNRVVDSPQIETPFVIGIFTPCIVFPEGLCMRDREYIFAHEKTHIKCGDNWIKLIFYVVLVCHWFNPMVWLFWSIATKDLEMACDSATTKNMSEQECKEYVQLLINMSCTEDDKILFTSYFGQRKLLMQRIRNLTRRKSKSKSLILLGSILIILMGLFAFFSIPDLKSDYELISDVLQEEELFNVFVVTDPAVVMNTLYDKSVSFRELESRSSAIDSIDAYIQSIVKEETDISSVQEMKRDQLLYIKAWIIKKEKMEEN